jgi:hypothetical protein
MRAWLALSVCLFSLYSFASAPDVLEVMRKYKLTVNPVSDQDVFKFSYRNRNNRVHAHFHFMKFLSGFDQEVSYSKLYPTDFPNSQGTKAIVEKLLFNKNRPSYFCRAIKGLELIWRSDIGQNECKKTVHYILDMAYRTQNKVYVFEAHGKTDQGQVFKEVGLLVYSKIDDRVSISMNMELY